MNIVKKPLVSFILFILLSVAILAGGSFFFIHETNSDVNKLNKTFLSEIAEQNANMMKKIVEMQLDKVSAVSNVLTNEPSLNQDRIIEVLSSESQRSSFKRMGYADATGYAITSDGQTIDISERAYFKKAIQGENSVSDRLVDKVGGAYINVYAVPFYQNGSITGVIFATNDSENFIDLLDSKTFNGLGYSYVVKKDGSPIAYPSKVNGSSSDLTKIFEEIDKTQVGKDKTNIIKDDMETEKDGFVTYAWNGVERVGAYSEVGIRDWYAVTLVPKSAITSNTDRIVFRNVLLVLLTAFIFIVFLALIILQGRKSRQELEKIAYNDEVTGSPNFKAFKKLAQKKLNEHGDFPYIFVMFDIENFKFINDRFGYKIGNDVLNSIANSLKELMDKGIECYARVAADEFIIMFREKHENFLEEIRASFVSIFNKNMGSDFNHLIRFHSGVYISDSSNHDFESIYEKVNYAHRQSKLVSSKEDITEFLYNDEVKKKAMSRIEIEDTMASALHLEAFEVFIQPKYCLKDETIAGGEALVRWRLKDGTLRFPGDFIPLFEENAFIIKLDMYMFEQICKLIQKWQQEGIPPICISVNFSRLHLFNSKFVSELVEISNRYNVPRNLIELELTETIFLENENLLDSVLEEAHAAGFTISMDDFGNGYSSLGLLKNINVDVIKVDRKFFVDDKDEERTKIVVEYVMKMAQKLGVHTLAEGIETKDHIDMLKDIGCEYVQGYYYAKPMPAHDFEKQLREQNERGQHEL